MSILPSVNEKLNRKAVCSLAHLLSSNAAISNETRMFVLLSMGTPRFAEQKAKAFRWDIPQEIRDAVADAYRVPAETVQPVA